MESTLDSLTPRRHSRGRIERHSTSAALAMVMGLVVPLVVIAQTPPSDPAPASATTIDTTGIGDALVVVDAPLPVFEAFAGETWRDAFGRWAKDAGYTLVWRAPNTVRVDAPVTMPAGTSFREAIGNVLRPLWRTESAVVGSFYLNRVLVIDQRGS